MEPITWPVKHGDGCRWHFFGKYNHSCLSAKFPNYFCGDKLKCWSLDLSNMARGYLRFSMERYPKGVQLDLFIDMRIFDEDGKRQMDQQWKVENLSDKYHRVHLHPTGPLIVDEIQRGWTTYVAIRRVEETIYRGKSATSIRIPTATEKRKDEGTMNKSVASIISSSKDSVLDARTSRGSVTPTRFNVNMTTEAVVKPKSVTQATPIQRGNVHPTAVPTKPIVISAQPNAKRIKTTPVPIAPAYMQSTSVAANDHIATESHVQVRPHPYWPTPPLADFHLQSVDNYEFHVNRLELYKKSDYFKALFTSDMKEKRDGRVKENFTGDAIYEVIRFLYDGKTTGNLPNVVDQVYDAAEKFDLADLKEICGEKLIDQISTDSVCESIEMAKLYGRDELFTESLKYVWNHRDDDEMPWDQLEKFCTGDGKFLKETFQQFTGVKKSLKRKRK